MNRIKLRILGIALIGIAFLAVGVHFLHAFQIKRNSGVFLELADQEEKAGNKTKAIEYLQKYQVYNPENKAVNAKRAILVADQGLGQPFNGSGIQSAMEQCDKVLRESPENDELRRKTVTLKMLLSHFRMRTGLLKEALESLDILVASSPNDSELYELKGLCFEAIRADVDKADGGFEQKTSAAFREADDAFQLAIEKDPTRITAYVYRANLQLSSKSTAGNNEANSCIKDMVERNPNSFEAYLERAIFRKGLAKDEERTSKALKNEIAEDIKKAAELAPDDERVLLISAQLAYDNGEIQTARRLLEKGVDQNPKNPGFYENLAKLELSEKKTEKAVAWLRRSITSNPNDVITLYRIATILADSGHLEKAEPELQALEKTTASALVAYLNARAAFNKSEWIKASNTLENVRDRLVSLSGAPAFSKIPATADTMLAKCYDHLGQNDRFLEVSQNLAQQNTSPQQLAQLAYAWEKNNKLDNALAIYSSLAAQDPSFEVDIVRLLFRRQLRSKAKREESLAQWWPELEIRLQKAEKTGNRRMDVVRERVALLLAQSVFAQVKQPDKAKQLQEEARSLIERSRDIFDSQLEYWLTLATVINRQGQPDQALALLNKAKNQTGDGVTIRLAFASHWLRLMRFKESRPIADKALEKLEQEDVDQFSAFERNALLAGLADARERAGQTEQAKRLWTEISKTGGQGESLQVLTSRLRLFDLALMENNQDEVAKVLVEIKELDPDGATWKYAEAMRLTAFSDASNQKAKSDADQLLNDARSKRPNWSRLVLLQAFLADRSQHWDQAVNDYLQAIELGERKPEVVRRVIELLLDPEKRGRKGDSELAIQTLADYEEKDGVLTPPLAKLATEIALNDGDRTKAKELIPQAVNNNSKSAPDFLWKAERLSQIGASPREIEDSLWAARRLDEKEPNVWLDFLLFYMGRGIEEAEGALELAKVNLSALKAWDKLGQCYEAMGRLDEAEKQFKAHVDAEPDDPQRLQLLAIFLQRHNQLSKAKPYFRKLIDPDKTKAKLLVQAWARRMLAMGLTTEGGYPNYLEALKLLEANQKALSDPPTESTKDDFRRSLLEDKRTKAAILSTRPEMHPEALKLLEEIATRQPPLTPEDKYLQARLFPEHEWQKARDILLELHANYLKNTTFLITLIQLLIKHDPAQAESFLRKLETMQPDPYQTLALKVMLLKETKKIDDAEKLLNDQAKRKDISLFRLGDLLEKIGRPNSAKNVYKAAVDQSKNPNGILIYAGFLGRQGETKEALDLCIKARESCPPEAVAVTSVGLLRTATDEALKSAALDSVKTWIENTYKSKPSPGLLTSLADLLDLGGRYEEAEQTWRKVLSIDSKNIMALNNLACLLSYRHDQGIEALEYINRAIELVGPDAELLDTRGLVYLARKDTALALMDLKNAVDLKPTSVKQVHLAQAYWQDNNPEEAHRYWSLAIKDNLELKGIHPKERPGLLSFQEDLNKQ
jgi:cellulose synthase operon protein C